MKQTENGNFDSCNSCKRLVPSRVHELHESIFPFLSRIEFIRSKLSNFSANAYGVTYWIFSVVCMRLGCRSVGEPAVWPAGHRSLSDSSAAERNTRSFWAIRHRGP